MPLDCGRSIHPTLGGATAMNAEYQVQKAGLAGLSWTTVCRSGEAKAREVFARQVRLYSVGRFRLLDPTGQIVDEQKACRLFTHA